MAFRKVIQHKTLWGEKKTTIEHMFIFNDTMEYEEDYVIDIETWSKVQAKNAFYDAQNNFDTKKVINQMIISTNTTN